jgi:hypothetical protein
MPYEPQKIESYSNMGGINAKISIYLTGQHECRDLSNLNFQSIGALTKRPGSTLATGATVIGEITGGIEFTKLSGASFEVITAGTNAYVFQPGSVFTPVKSGLKNNALFSFVTFVDRLFCANGTDFFKFDGSNTSNFSLPPGQGAWGVTAVSGGSIPNGTYVVGYGYLNDRGYLGPTATGITITLSGGNGTIQYYGLTTPTGFGVTSLALYRSNVGFNSLFGTTYAPIGTTTVLDTGFALNTVAANFNLWFTLAPKFLEISNNMLFLSGISSMPSTVFWSDVGEPEGIDPTFFDEFRTNDGDVVTGMRAYNSALAVTKERSFHVVTGTDPTNLSVVQLSDQYGCISHRALVIFNNILWFLDPKGICEYNGANIGIVSNKVEPIFTRMNLAAARQNACAIHYKQFNEVWFCFPVDAATQNNVIVVFDYVSNAWTKYEGIIPAYIWLAFGNLAQKTAFFGSYSGSVSYFSASLFGDNGSAITCMIKSPYLAPMGETVTKQFRRFYGNVDTVSGASVAISLQFTQDFNDGTVSATGAIYQSPFQTRLDFGIPAKTISFAGYHVSASLPFRLEGYAFEARFQRNT